MQNMEPQRAAADVAPLATAMREELEDMTRKGPLLHWRRPTIYRVFPRIRREDIRVHEPRLISIGPFHRGKEGLRAMESHKWRYLQDLLARSPGSRLDKCVSDVIPRVKEIRAQYSETLDAITDEELVRTMVLDGCFIIEYLLKLYMRDVDAAFMTPGWVMTLLWQDLLLSENQVPFFVLETLFKAATPRAFTVALSELALCIMSNGRVRSLPQPQPQPFVHLLHVCHSVLVFLPQMATPRSFRWVTCGMLRRMRKMGFHACHSVASLLTCSSPEEDSDGRPTPSFLTIPHATKLKEAGVRFTTRETDPGVFLGDINLVRFANGTLELPFLMLSDHNFCRLYNLVTFEQCYPEATAFFTSLAHLMNHLMQTEGDVELLQDCGAVYHELESLGDAALFFKKLFRDAFLRIDRDYYAMVVKQVNDYCEVDRRRWREG